MIGIDLGTTNSLVSIFENGEPRILANELGEELTPSAVAIAEDGSLLVGRPAKDRLAVDPKSGKAFFKRDIGSGATYSFGGQSWDPVTLSALILREMLRIAQMHTGGTLDSAVITVPAYFHDQQRQATLEAAKIAGIKVDRIVNEPTAAALAYGYRNPDLESQILVFDLGGGTFDVTLLEIFDGVIEVKSSAGESRLGGEDYTDAFCSFLEEKHQWTPPADQTGSWRQRVEITKRQLSSKKTASISIDENLVEVTREQLIESTQAITNKLRPIMTRCLRDAHTSAADLSDVLLVGGASRMPPIRDFIHTTLKRIPSSKVDPDRVVALGAAVQACLCADGEAVSDIVLTDVAPHTLGVEIAKEHSQGRQEPGYFSPIIDRNSVVPTSKLQTYNTFHPHQDEIDVKVYQGESRLTKDNQRIGALRVTGLRQRPGQEQPGLADIRFSYDMNGILEVEVTALSSGKKQSLVIEQRPGTLSKKEMAAALERLKPLKFHPRDLLPNRARLERASRVYTELLGPAREQLNFLVDQFEAALATQSDPDIKMTAASLDSFLKPFFKLERESLEEEPQPLEPSSAKDSPPDSAS